MKKKKAYLKYDEKKSVQENWLAGEQKKTFLKVAFLSNKKARESRSSFTCKIQGVAQG